MISKFTAAFASFSALLIAKRLKPLALLKAPVPGFRPRIMPLRFGPSFGQVVRDWRPLIDLPWRHHQLYTFGPKLTPPTTTPLIAQEDAVSAVSSSLSSTWEVLSPVESEEEVDLSAAALPQEVYVSFPLDAAPWHWIKPGPSELCYIHVRMIASAMEEHLRRILRLLENISNIPIVSTDGRFLVFRYKDLLRVLFGGEDEEQDLAVIEERVKAWTDQHLGENMCFKVYSAPAFE